MKKRTIIIVASCLGIIALLAFFIIFSIENEKDKTFIRAHDAIQSGDYDRAEELLDRIPEYNGASKLMIQLLYARGAASYEAGKETQAEKDFQKIRDYKNAQDYLDQIYLHRAEAYLFEGRYEAAEAAIKAASDAEDVNSFRDKLYRSWSEVIGKQGNYEVAYRAAVNIKNKQEGDEELLCYAAFGLVRDKLKAGDMDEAEKLLSGLDAANEKVSRFFEEIKMTKLAKVCISELKDRYAGEIQVEEIKEVRCSEQIYKGVIQLPVVMVMFSEKNTLSGEVKDAYALYDNDVYLLTCHSRNKNEVDMKDATEMSGYLKLSQNWESDGVFILEKKCLE